MSLDKTKCRHGRDLEAHKKIVGDFVIAAPMSTCDCCLTRFWYIDNAVIGWDKSTGEVNSDKGEEWVPTNRCGGCGGHVVKFDHPTVEVRAS